MTRVPLLLLALAVLVASGLESGSDPSAFAQAPVVKPNLLVIMTDDLETDDLKALPSVRLLAASRARRSPTRSSATRCAAHRARQ